MNFTSGLFKLARLFADLRAIKRSAESGSPMPLIRRGVNKAWGRKVISKLWWKP